MAPSDRCVCTCACAYTCSAAVVDLTVNLETATSYEEIMAELKRASEEELKGILG